MSILHKLTVKPWVQDRGTVVDFRGGGALPLPAAKLGLGLFLAVVTVLFALLVSAYVMRMALADWRPLPEPGLLWLNTAILVLSSAALQRARIAARRRRLDGVRRGLLAGGVFAFAFLAGQLLAWRQLDASGYFLATNPANAFFYLITALHGLHLLGGLVAWGKTVTRLWRGHEVARLGLGVELCAVYWHFLLAVWLILFGLLLST
ncbi:MAG: cytochrome c oxidase subunit 3 [Sphingomonadales bacterium]